MVVSVDVEDLLALDGQNAGEDTLGQAGSCEIATVSIGGDVSFVVDGLCQQNRKDSSFVPNTTTSYSGAISSAMVAVLLSES